MEEIGNEAQCCILPPAPVCVNYPALTDGFPLHGPTSPPEGSTGSTAPAQTDTRAGRGAPHGPSLRRLRTRTPSVTVIGTYLREVLFKFGRRLNLGDIPREGSYAPQAPREDRMSSFRSRLSLCHHSTHFIHSWLSVGTEPSATCPVQWRVVGPEPKGAGSHCRVRSPLGGAHMGVGDHLFIVKNPE